MASYELVKSDQGYYSVIGLKYDDPNPEWNSSDTILIVIYEAGDCDHVTCNNEKMHESLIRSLPVQR